MSRNMNNTILGIEWACQNNADIISMSLGTEQPKDGSDPLSVAVQNAVEKYGVSIVVAAGNFGVDRNNPGRRVRSSIGTPGACRSAITVGAVRFDPNTGGVTVADFSSIGPVKAPGLGQVPELPQVPEEGLDDMFNVKPDICAPGQDILAARAKEFEFKPPRDPNRRTNNVPADFEQYYTFKSGTSMATPIVSGSIALILEAFRKAYNITDENQWRDIKQRPIEDRPNLAYFIKKVLLETAIPLPHEPEYEMRALSFVHNPELDKSVVSGAGFLRVDRCIQRVLSPPQQPFIMQPTWFEPDLFRYRNMVPFPLYARGVTNIP